LTINTIKITYYYVYKSMIFVANIVSSVNWF
jgi:hypothetical protein